MFGEHDSWQLIYGSQRWREGKHQWEISVGLVDKPEKEEEKKAEGCVL